MDVAGGEEGMNARALGVPQRVNRGLHVGPIGPSERSHVRPRELTADRIYRLRISLRGDRETGFEDIDAQFHQFRSHPEFLWHGHAASGRLFPVSKSRIEDVNAVSHGKYLLSRLWGRPVDLANL